MSRSRLLVLVAALAAGLVLGVSPPASAHDELLASSPAAGERLETVPTSVTLTFSGDVLTIGAAVIVVDAAGRDLVVGEPEVADGTVTAHVETPPGDGGYEIRWRVVSADGHPISGIVPFTVGDGQPLVRAPGATTDGATDAGMPSAHEDQVAPRVILIGLGGAAVALAILLLTTFLRRRAHARGTDSRDAPASGEPNEPRRNTP